MKHSKLPWFISKCALHQGHYDIISPTRLVTCVKGNNKKDASFIVKACNNHKDLLDLAKNIARGVDVDIDSVKDLIAEIED